MAFPMRTDGISDIRDPGLPQKNGTGTHTDACFLNYSLFYVFPHSDRGFPAASRALISAACSIIREVFLSS